MYKIIIKASLIILLRTSLFNLFCFFTINSSFKLARTKKKKNENGMIYIMLKTRAILLLFHFKTRVNWRERERFDHLAYDYLPVLADIYAWFAYQEHLDLGVVVELQLSRLIIVVLDDHLLRLGAVAVDYHTLEPCLCGELTIRSEVPFLL